VGFYQNFCGFKFLWVPTSDFSKIKTISFQEVGSFKKMRFLYKLSFLVINEINLIDFKPKI